MAPKRGAGDGDAGWLEVVLVIVSVLGALAVVVMIVGVSLPNGLKFVFAVMAAMLSAICAGLAVALQQQRRRP
jgi:hypothetical protein